MEGMDRLWNIVAMLCTLLQIALLQRTMVFKDGIQMALGCTWHGMILIQASEAN